MATIIPFRGIRYDTGRVDINDVTTPPYDVIDASGQEYFYQKNPYNIIRLELGKKFPEDSDDDNRYTRAAKYLEEWLESGVLKNDDKPSVYLYEQEFDVKGEKKIRSGFITGVQANDYSKGEVLPHEETLPKHKADRLNLMKATLANFSPIFGLYADKEHVIENALETARANRRPDAEATDSQGVINRLWVISDEKALELIKEKLSGEKIFIADGHHRYETAVNFGREMAAQGKQGYDYLMVCLVNLYNKGLVVFPTHRVVKNIKSLDIAKLLNEMGTDFSVAELPSGTSLNEFIEKLENIGMGGPAFGIYAGSNDFYILTLTSPDKLDLITDNEHSSRWKQLDVAILHSLILEKYLGIGSKQRADESNLIYVRDEDAAKEFVDSGEAQLVFYMNATKVEEVTDIATGGEKMPQKSTFFYPKVITGMVMNNYKK
ncbi:DUF1015 domain-containing protein [Phosphitispora sp. TUW77]|uniref:DUF1015 domain-containing protein n=1 Tax=Phosphitispora sp. TUW77 TaxID=3152361 RepID=UPI003AB8DF82